MRLYIEKRWKIFRKNKNWLRFQTESELKKIHSDFFPSRSQRILKNTKDFITNGRSWWFVILLVFLLFVVGSFINFHFVEYKTSIELINNRIRDLSALFSISLVVLGFMLNNIAQKSSLILRILFKEIYMYPIIYFSLSVIGTLIVVATFVDILPEEKFKSLFVIGIILLILVLFLIGFLFTKAFLFVGKSEIDKRLKKELLIEAKKNMIGILIQYKSSELFSLFMKENDIEEKKKYKTGSLFLLFRSLSTSSFFSRSEDQSRCIEDINLKVLGDKIKKLNDQKPILCSTLRIGEVLDLESDKPIFNIGNKELTLNESPLIKLLCIENMADKEQLMFREYFDKEFKKHSNDGDYDEMSKVLENYYELYIIQLKYQDKSSLKDNLGYYLDITESIDTQVRLAIRKSIEQDNLEGFKVLSNFVMQILYTSLFNDSLNHFEKYIYLPSLSYRESKLNKDFEKTSHKFHEYCAEDASGNYKRILETIVGIKKESKTIEEIERVNRFAETTFNNFSKLLYRMIMNQELEQFKHAIEDYKQLLDYDIVSNSFDLEDQIRGLKNTNENSNLDEKIKEKERELKVKRAFGDYYKYSIFSLRCWILFMYDKSILSKDLTQGFIQHLNFVHLDDNWLKGLLILRRKSEHYLERSSWDYIKRQSGVAYVPISVEHWMTQGMFIESIKKRSNFNVNLDTSIYSVDEVEKLREEFKKHDVSIEDDFEKWKEVLNKITLKEYRTRLDKILQGLNKTIAKMQN